VLVTNWTQFVEHFSSIEEGGRRNPYLSGSYLAHAVYGYFQNGGGRCYVTRVAPPAANGKASDHAKLALQLPTRASKAVASLTVTPKAALSTDIQIEVAPPTPAGSAGTPAAGAAGAASATDGDAPAPDGIFTLRFRMADVIEEYPNVSLGKGKGTKNVVETINQASKLVTIVEGQTNGPLAERLPEIGTFVIKAPEASMLPAVQPNDFMGSAEERSGVEGLEIAEDVTIIACPDLMAAYQAGAIDRDGVKSVQLAMMAHCERMGDRVAILDPLPDLTPQQVKRWREVETNYDSKFAALYYPWIKITGPDGKPMAVPPSGHMAGIFAKTDTERGVHKAPANEVVLGALEAVNKVTKGEQDTLNPIGVNCIRSFTGRGLRVWGARTLSSDPAWRYINVRRLFNFARTSIENGLQWVVFEPNDPTLWAKVRRDVSAFLTGVWREGALFGATPEQAFFVKCDEELNPSDVRDRGQLFIDVGLAPVKPAEFVVFRLSQWSGGGA
jgi:phage tail sheath protein FI